MTVLSVTTVPIKGTDLLGQQHFIKILVCGVSFLLKHTVEEYIQGPLLYLTSIICHFPPRVWAIGRLGYVNAIKKPTGSVNR